MRSGPHRRRLLPVSQSKAVLPFPVPSRQFRRHACRTLSSKGSAATHIYMDLGVSSMQIDTTERGFSYSYDAPLDMRMDPVQALTAAEILNTWTEPDLVALFEPLWRGKVLPAHSPGSGGARGGSCPFARTSELVDTIKWAIPTPARFGAGNPARRVFQALRIEVNDELNSLRRALPGGFALLEPGGVLAVISFHSLEDRMVKEFFAGKARACTCPPEFPVCVCGGQATGGECYPQGHRRPARGRWRQSRGRVPPNSVP